MFSPAPARRQTPQLSVNTAVSYFPLGAATAHPAGMSEAAAAAAAANFAALTSVVSSPLASAPDFGYSMMLPLPADALHDFFVPGEDDETALNSAATALFDEISAGGNAMFSLPSSSVGPKGSSKDSRKLQIKDASGYRDSSSQAMSPLTPSMHQLQVPPTPTIFDAMPHSPAVPSIQVAPFAEGITLADALAASDFFTMLGSSSKNELQHQQASFPSLTQSELDALLPTPRTSPMFNAIDVSGGQQQQPVHSPLIAGPKHSPYLDGGDDDEQSEFFSTLLLAGSCPTTPATDNFSFFPDMGALNAGSSSSSNTLAPPAAQPTLHACFCGKQFRSPQALRAHTKLHVFPERVHLCGTCGRKFARKHDLRRHETTHVKGKTAACSRCGVQFTRLDALYRHVKARRCKL